MKRTEIVEVYAEDVQRIARSVWRTWRQPDADDIAQELWLWLLAPVHQPVIDAYREDGDEGYYKLKRALRNHATNYCRAEQAARAGYSTSDLYYYSIPQLEDLLPFALGVKTLPEHLLGVTYDDMPKPKGDPAEGGDFIAMVMDVTKVVGVLTEDDLQFIQQVDDANKDWDKLSEGTGIEPRSMYVRYRRVIGKLQKALGGPEPEGLREYTGTRHAMSNSAAQARTGSEYDG